MAVRRGPLAKANDLVVLGGELGEGLSADRRGTVVLVGLGVGTASTSLNRPLPTRTLLCLGMAVTFGAFAITGLVDGALAGLLAVPAVLGGLVGTRLVGRHPDPALRADVVLTATAGAIWLLGR